MTGKSQRYLSNLNCPHCGCSLSRVLTDPMSDWQGEELLCCFNDECPYTKNSWRTMQRQGVPMGYRYFFCPANGGEGALLIQNGDSYKDRLQDWEAEPLEIEDPDSIEFKNLLEAIDSAVENGQTQLVIWLRQLKRFKYPGRN
jgi:hypothetical protein